jgi:two-component system response regulator RegA
MIQDDKIVKKLMDATRHECSVPTAQTPLARTVLIVDDDKPLRHRSAQAMEARGFQVTTAESVADGVARIKLCAPAYAVVDMRLDDGCGLDIISALKQHRSDARAIIQTSYGNSATAVAAVKLGAVGYLTKPADADDVVFALLAPEGCKAASPQHPMSADYARWEHIQNI